MPDGGHLLLKLLLRMIVGKNLSQGHWRRNFEEFQKIFDSFLMSGGTGLGLTISKKNFACTRW